MTKRVREIPKEEELDYPLSFQSPESSNVSEASYDPETETLSVTFTSGQTYGYAPFPENLWREFAMATSKGKFFAVRVRPWFQGRAK